MSMRPTARQQFESMRRRAVHAETMARIAGAEMRRMAEQCTIARESREVLEAALSAMLAHRFAPADDADGGGLTYRVHAQEWERACAALAQVSATASAGSTGSAAGNQAATAPSGSGPGLAQ